MRVTRTAAAAFTAEFENEQELREEHRTNLSMGALRLTTSEKAALHTVLLVTLRGPWGGEAFAKATVVGALADGIALAIEGDPDQILLKLLAKTEQQEVASANVPTEETVPEAPSEETPEKSQNIWDRV